MVVHKVYVPEQGDVVWIDFDPTKGHEQKGRRPAVVLSSKIYNEPSRLFVVCPVSSQIKGYPYEVMLAGKLQGVILVDHVRSLDWSARPVKKAGVVSEDTLVEIQKKLKTLLF